MTTKIHAILALVPNAIVTVRGDDVEWHSPITPPVTENEIQAKLEELIAEHAANEYQRLRAPEYPSITDQLDSLFHAGVFPVEMAAKIQTVKDKYPKP
jgi:hypothetical protein